MTGIDYTIVTRYSDVMFLITLALLGVCIIMLVESKDRQTKIRTENINLREKLRKTDRRLRKLNNTRAEIASIASHQLRKPLAALRGHITMLLEGAHGKIPQKATGILGELGEKAHTTAFLVEDLLFLSRITSGSMRYELSDCSIQTLTKHVVDELRPSAFKKGLLLTFSSRGNGSSVVHVDVPKIRHVLFLVINNALLYTSEGKVTVKLEKDERRKKVRVVVSDTGIGMDQKVLEEIFDMFERGKNARDVNTTGKGLSLFIAKEILEHTGGSITADSKGSGKGSTFTIELPLKKKRKS